MNERFQELRKVAVQQADDEVAHLERVHNRKYLIGEWSAIFSDKFAELIVEEHINLLKQEWYALNNAPEVENETPRDIGIRLGRKGEIISLIGKIKKHFGVEK